MCNNSRGKGLLNPDQVILSRSSQVLKVSSLPKQLGLLFDCANTEHFFEDLGTAGQLLYAFLGYTGNQKKSFLEDNVESSVRSSVHTVLKGGGSWGVEQL